jgi:hypothetical protein
MMMSVAIQSSANENSIEAREIGPAGAVRRSCATVRRKGRDEAASGAYLPFVEEADMDFDARERHKRASAAVFGLILIGLGVVFTTDGSRIPVSREGHARLKALLGEEDGKA